MSNVEDLFDDDEEFSQAELPKKLRAKIKELSAELNEARAESTTLKADSRKILGETLTQRGLNPKIAQFIPADLDEDGIGEWLNENAEVFSGGQAADTPAQTVIARDAEQAQAIKRMANSERGATTGQEVNSVMSGIENSTNMEELMAALNSA